MEDSNNKYSQAHLEIFQRIYGVDDWFELYDRPTRFQDILSKSLPPCRGQLESEEGGPASWDLIPLIVDGDYFGLWPDPTPEELYVADLIRTLTRTWLGFGCWHDPESELALKLKGFYEKLCAYSDSNMLVSHLQECQPDALEPISHDHIDYWIENWATNG